MEKLIERYRKRNIDNKKYNWTSLVPSHTFNKSQVDELTGEVIRGVVIDVVLYPTYSQAHYNIYKSLLNSGLTFCMYFHDLEHLKSADDLENFYLGIDCSGTFLRDDQMPPKAIQEHLHVVILVHERTTATAVAKNLLKCQSHLIVMWKKRKDFGWRCDYGTHKHEKDKPFKYDFDDCEHFYFSNNLSYQMAIDYKWVADESAESIMRRFRKYLQFTTEPIDWLRAFDWFDDNNAQNVLRQNHFMIDRLIKAQNDKAIYDRRTKVIRRA